MKQLDTPTPVSRKVDRIDERNCTKITSTNDHFSNSSAKDDFSIFVDNTSANLGQKQPSDVSHPPKQSLEEGTQFYYDQTTVKDLHSNMPKKSVLAIGGGVEKSRKPFGVISDEDDFAKPSMPNFELTDTITRVSNFDPSSASTRFHTQSNQSEATNFKHHDFERQLEEDSEAEKDKLLEEYFQNNKANTCAKKDSSLWSNSNNNTIQSPKAAEADIDGSSSTKKVKFDETQSSGKTKSWSSTKCGQWDDEFERTSTKQDDSENNTHENHTGIENDLTKLISPSNKLFSDKTEKLNLNALKMPAASISHMENLETGLDNI